MAGRRKTTPLFEIMSRNGNGVAPESERAPTERLEPKPGRVQAEWHAEAEDAPAERVRAARAEQVRPERGNESGGDAGSAAGGDGGRTFGKATVGGGVVRLPINYVYIVLSVVLVTVLIAWSVGYSSGNTAAQEEAREEIESATNAARPREVDPPSGNGVPATGPGQATPAPGGGSTPATPVSAPPAGAGGLPAIVAERTDFKAPGGYYATEPREAGLNYFCLVSRLPEADTERALEFLARNGVAALGVEQRGGTANNRLFALYTLEGLTRDEYAGRDNPQRRSRHESLVAELGRRWQGEERGTSDFSQPQWFRFSP
ncbi:MAG: hypothetical protein KDA05_03550 [Phycisphaerales bacterium]|nr:hypothetical protein [Phycisphaerales bacterium]MCB9840695.1 hypothetical protein [Phycisphaeraceae bacterium]